MGCGGSKYDSAGGMPVEQAAQPNKEDENLLHRPDFSQKESGGQSPEELERKRKRKEERNAAKERRKQERAKHREQLLDLDNGPKDAGSSRLIRPNKIFDNAGIAALADDSGVSDMHHDQVFEAFKFYMEEKGIDDIDQAGFLEVIGRLGLFKDSDDLALQLFRSLDTNRNGSLDLGELSAGLAVFSKGSKREKVKLVFSSYDKDGDGEVTKEELKSLILTQVRASLNASAMALAEEDEFDQFFDNEKEKKTGEEITTHKLEKQETNMFRFSDKGDGKIILVLKTPLGEAELELTKDEALNSKTDAFVRLKGDEFLDKMVNDVFAQYDKDDNGVINFDEFYNFVLHRPEMQQWFYD